MQKYLAEAIKKAADARDFEAVTQLAQIAIDYDPADYEDEICLANLEEQMAIEMPIDEVLPPVTDETWTPKRKWMELISNKQWREGAQIPNTFNTTDLYTLILANASDTLIDGDFTLVKGGGGKTDRPRWKARISEALKDLIRLKVIEKTGKQSYQFL